MELLDKDKKFVKEYKRIYKLPFVLLILWFINVIVTCVVSNIANIPIEFNEPQFVKNQYFGIFKYLLMSVVISPFLFIIVQLIASNIIRKSVCKKYCNSKQEAINRQIFLFYEIKYVPLLQRFSKMNLDAKSSQFKLLKEWYSLEDASISEYFFNREYSEEDWNNAVKQLREEEIDFKKTFINNLFQFVMLEDGIHNDEWNLMMQLIAQLQLNKNYVNYFKERYNPLRTEFDESEWKEKSSTTTYTLTSPKEYYDVLGLKEGASYEELKRAYHELALQHHPDLPKNAGRTKECEKMMMKINEAYEKLRSKS